MAGKKSSGKSRSSRAGITMPVARVARALKTGKYAERFGRTAPVFLAGALDYLAAELIELSGSVAKKAKKQRITPRAINLAVRADADLNALLGDALVSGGGVQPHINKVRCMFCGCAVGRFSSEVCDPPSLLFRFSLAHLCPCVFFCLISRCC